MMNALGTDKLIVAIVTWVVDQESNVTLRSTNGEERSEHRRKFKRKSPFRRKASRLRTSIAEQIFLGERTCD
jgi:hypothetical protein